MMLDNVFRGGSVLDTDDDDPANVATRVLNERLAADERVDVAMIAGGGRDHARAKALSGSRPGDGTALTRWIAPRRSSSSGAA